MGKMPGLEGLQDMERQSRKLDEGIAEKRNSEFIRKGEVQEFIPQKANNGVGWIKDVVDRFVKPPEKEREQLDDDLKKEALEVIDWLQMLRRKLNGEIHEKDLSTYNANITINKAIDLIKRRVL